MITDVVSQLIPRETAILLVIFMELLLSEVQLLPLLDLELLTFL